MGRLLTMLPSAPYRQYPTRRSRQGPFEREQDVCGHCLTGSCCSSEDPIALTSFDVLRLAAFLDLSPAAFLAAFTQDRFADDPNADRRRSLIESAESSVVTFLRRRGAIPTSPCIFLKYVREADGTPRRICGVHPGRPLSCREYYYDTCKLRATGELAAAQAEGYEMLRDGLMSADDAAASCAALGPARPDESLSAKWQRAFWGEMRRAADVEATNEEGSVGFAIVEYQDPLDAKVNRLLSKPYLRFEEKYGPMPHREQLDEFEAGTSFSRSPERERLLRIVRTPPGRGLFGPVDYPHYIGLRTLLSGLTLGTAGAPIPPAQSDAAGVARGWAFLTALAEHAQRSGNLLELEPEGTLELALLEALTTFRPEVERAVPGGERVDETRRWAADVIVGTIGARRTALQRRPAAAQGWLRLYASVARLDGIAPTPELRDLISDIKARAADLCSRKRPRAQRRTRQLDDSELPRAVARLMERKTLGALVRGGCEDAARQLERLAIERVFDSDPGWSFEVIDRLARPAASAPDEPLEGLLASLARRWAESVEARCAWTPDLMLRWPALCVTLRIASATAPGWNRALAHVRAAQAPDGSWGADLRAADADAIGSQGEYLLGVVRATAAALQALCAELFEHAPDGAGPGRPAVT